MGACYNIYADLVMNRSSGADRQVILLIRISKCSLVNSILS